MARMAKKRLTKSEAKAAADRAEARSKGEEPAPDKDASPLNPPVVTRKPMGRPTKYSPDMCEQLIESGRMGASKTQMARDLGISKETLFVWLKTNPEFAAAMEEAMALSMAWWEDQGRNALWADKFQATAWIFQMKTRFPDTYSDVTRHEHTGKGGGAIEVTDGGKMEEARRVAFALGRALERQRMKVIDGETG